MSYFRCLTSDCGNNYSNQYFLDFYSVYHRQHLFPRKVPAFQANIFSSHWFVITHNHESLFIWICVVLEVHLFTEMLWFCSSDAGSVLCISSVVFMSFTVRCCFFSIVTRSGNTNVIFSVFASGSFTPHSVTASK